MVRLTPAGLFVQIKSASRADTFTILTAQGSERNRQQRLLPQDFLNFDNWLAKEEHQGIIIAAFLVGLAEVLLQPGRYQINKLTLQVLFQPFAASITGGPAPAFEFSFKKYGFPIPSGNNESRCCLKGGVFFGTRKPVTVTDHIAMVVPDNVIKQQSHKPENHSKSTTDIKIKERKNKQFLQDWLEKKWGESENLSGGVQKGNYFHHTIKNDAAEKQRWPRADKITLFARNFIP
jgi:hypothetical protein